DLEPDVSRADQREPTARHELRRDRVDVVERAQIMDAGEIGSGDAKLAHAAAGREHERVEGQDAAVFEPDAAGGGLELDGARPDDDLRGALAVPRLGPQREALARHFACEILLRQGRALIRRMALAADDDDAACIAVLP